jgi:hypothetical protein
VKTFKECEDLSGFGLGSLPKHIDHGNSASLSLNKLRGKFCNHHIQLIKYNPTGWEKSIVTPTKTCIVLPWINLGHGLRGRLGGRRGFRRQGNIDRESPCKIDFFARNEFQVRIFPLLDISFNAYGQSCHNCKICNFIFMINAKHLCGGACMTGRIPLKDF